MSGFEHILDTIEDLLLDCPQAAHLVGLFLGRAIVDDVLPPSFLSHVVHMLPDHSIGMDIVQTVSERLGLVGAAKFYGECWGKATE